jgi:hypothetical protein
MICMKDCIWYLSIGNMTVIWYTEDMTFIIQKTP